MSQENQATTRRMQTPHGIVELTAQTERVVNNDRSTSDIHHWSIRMSRDQSTTAPSMDQLGISRGGQQMINESASWLRYEGNLNGLEPRTVIIAGNQTQGGAYEARWHGSDRPGSGRLTEFLVPTQSGWRQVPNEVLNQVPTDRVTDVIRPNGTSFQYIVPEDGSGARWNASYLDDQNRRVDLTFAANNELAIRRVNSNRPGEGAVITYGPGNDDLPRRSDALTVPQGGRKIEENGLTTVINAAGDVRTQWTRDNDGGYTQIRQIEHLEVDGKPSQWRVSQDLTNNSATIYRVDSDNRVIGQPVGLTIGSDNSLIIPRDGNTDALDVASLRMPSGRNITIVAPTVERSDPDINTRQVPLTANGTRFSDRETIEEKAGYDNPSQAQWQRRSVEMPRSIAEQLNIPVPAGQNTVTREIEVLAHQSATGRYSMRDGTELYANTAGDRLVVANANTQTRTGAQVAVTEFDNAFLVPSNGRPAHQVLRDLANQGLEPVAVLGTGFITPQAGENGSKVIGYHYTNLARLEDGQEARRNIQPTELRDSNNGTNLRAGYWVDAKGEMHLLNLDRERFPQPQQVNAELEKMKNDPNVVAIHLFTHQAARGPQDLIGNAPYDPDRGGRGWTPRPPGQTGGQYDTDPSNNLESRSLLVFDENQRFVGRLSTPPIAMRDTYSTAREIYGDRAAYVLNGDGDFYARAWYLDSRAASDPLALGYENAMILVRPTPNGQPAQLREFNDSERSSIRDYGSQEGFWDNINDIWKNIQRRFSDAGDGNPIAAASPNAPAPNPLATQIGSDLSQSTAALLAARPDPVATPNSTPIPSSSPSIVDDRRFPDILAGVNQNPRLADATDLQRQNLTAVLTLDADKKQLQAPFNVLSNDQGTYAFAIERNPLRPESQQYAQAEVAPALQQPLALTNERYREQQVIAQNTPQPDALARATEEPSRGSVRQA